MVDNLKDTNVTLDGEEVTLELLAEKEAQLSKSERIVEVQSGKYETIKRMNG